jgi:sigma-54 dependent transcriptional regulator, acetoin dehydrogenase operon transcriptional activator AcoR
VVRLPRLRDRTDLAIVIQKMLLRESIACGNRQPLHVAPDVMAMFEQCPWPGNFRQLGNLLRTAAAMVDADGEIRREHLPDDFFDDLRSGASQSSLVNAPSAGNAFMPENARLQEVTVSVIAAALARHGGNVSAAARELGVSRNTIYRKMPGVEPGRAVDDF